MEYSKHLYRPSDISAVIEAATGRPYPLSMLNYLLAERIIMPVRQAEVRGKYYEFYQVVWIYVLRFLKEYGVPATRIKDVMTPKFKSVLKDYCNGKIQAVRGNYIICSETLITLDGLEGLTKGQIDLGREFFWCLPLDWFKRDVELAINELDKQGKLKLANK